MNQEYLRRFENRLRYQLLRICTSEKLLEGKPPKDIAEEFYKLKFDIQVNLNAVYAAKETVLELIKMQPKNAFYHYELSLMYYNIQDYSQAEKALKQF